jgi:Uma2 family endonuclease
MQSRLLLSAADEGRELSYEEFQAADYSPAFRYELIEGRLAVSPSPEFAHQELVAWLASVLILDSRRRGRPFRVSQNSQLIVPHQGGLVTTALGPDISCFPKPTPPRSETTWRDVSPFLVVEIISPESAAKDLTRNRGLYLRCPSIREYWIVDTRQGFGEPSLIVYRRRGSRWAAARHVPFAGTYETELLPEFVLTMSPD